MEKRSKKTLEDYYTEDLLKDPYKEVNLQDIAESQDPEAMQEAVKKQKKQRGYFDRLKAKLEK
jgi:SAM-dependent MidA family methyltransferase